MVVGDGGGGVFLSTLEEPHTVAMHTHSVAVAAYSCRQDGVARGESSVRVKAESRLLMSPASPQIYD